VKRILCTTLCIVCLSVPATAAASGYYIPKTGGDTAGPTTANGSALFWNPAAMSLIDGHSVFLEAQPIWRKNAWNPSEPGLGKAENARWNVLPAAAATFTIHDRIKAGLGVFIPYGLSNDYQPYNGPQRFSIIYADMRSAFFMPSVSVDVYKSRDSRLAFAAGVVYAYTWLDLYRAFDASSIIPGQQPRDRVSDIPAGNEARTHMQGDAHTFSFDLGALWQLGPLVVGASYVHSMQPEIEGTLQSYLQPTMPISGSLSSPMAARVGFALPSTARLGVEYRFDSGRASLRLQGDWSNWSQFKSQTVRVSEPAGVSVDLDQHLQRNFRDTWGARLATSVFVLPWLELMGASGFDGAAIPDASMTPEMNDAFLWGFALGPKAWFGLGKDNFLNQQHKRSGLLARHDALGVHLLWNPLFYQTREVRGTVSKPGSDGRYSTIVHLIDLHVDYRF